MIKSTRRINFHQLTKLIASKSLFCCSSQKITKPTLYPYVFGGLKNVQFVQNEVPYTVIQAYFNKDSFDGFKEAYRSVLYSLAQKDNLSDIIEPSFYNKIKYENVELINPDAEIQIICGKFFIVIGGGFDRSQYEYKKLDMSKMTSSAPINPRQQVKKCFYVGNKIGEQQGLRGLSTYPPTLQAYEILFRSAMKLIPEGGNREDKQPEIHSLQFEVEGKINLSPLSVMKTYLVMKLGGLFNPLEAQRKVLRQIVGDEYEWKIGDMDRVLNGNLELYQ